MQSEDQYLERTPDLVAKVRAMREAAEKEMNCFTRIADYDVRRVAGQKPKSAAKSAPAQPTLEFPPAPAEHGDNGEGA
jgi:hypothetical protein